MRRTTISNLRQFLLALLFPAVAIATGLQSCNDEGPGIPAEESGPAKSSGNPLMRSPEEALDIAQRAYEEFYGDATPSSRGRSIIDCSRPVEVVRGARSRGGSSDTLLYIVNFVDDQGFAVIAAPRAADELLAVTSQGHYYPESDPEAGSVPGFDLWMEAAGDYAASIQFPSLGDSIKLPKDTFVIVKGDTLLPPVNPGGGTSIIFDSTKIVNPDEPGLLQHKEWEDTVQNYISGPKITVTWGQGNALPLNINAYPEGYYFENGWAGCATAAIAQVCAYYESPTSINKTPLLGATPYPLNWAKLRTHRKKHSLVSVGECEDDMETHMMIAEFYRIIAVWTDAHPHGETGTGTLTSNVLPMLRSILPERNIFEWKDLKFTVTPLSNELFVMEGKSETSGHIWLCDGFKRLVVDHYFASRTNSYADWEIQSVERFTQNFLHYNWGWYGRYDGWYNNAVSVIIYKYDGTRSYYQSLKYARIQ